MLIVIVSVAVLWLPGAVLARVCRLAPNDFVARLGYEFALGLAFWPLLFLFTSLTGFAWTPLAARIVVVVLLVFVILSAAKDLKLRRLRSFAALRMTALALFALVVWTRIAHITDVVWPLWVDSVHHTMIVRLIVEQGTLPSSYAPFIPDSTFYYHWGFHAVAAFAAWVAGVDDPVELPRFLLLFGQVLNALTFFAVYTGAAAMLRRRRAALLAATLATLVSFFPAYYVSWGRYTQLAGLLILPPLAAAYWLLARHPTKGRAAAVAILAAGLLLIHIRVAAVFAVLAVILTIVVAMQGRRRGLAWCAAAAAIAVVLAAPWLVRLACVPQVGTILRPGVSQRWETSNAAPADLLWAPHNVPLYILGTAGLFALLPLRPIDLGWRIAGIALWLALVYVMQRRARSRRHALAPLAILAAWVAITALLINVPHLPRIVPNSAAIVMLFLPLSIAGAHVIDWLLPQRKAMLVVTILIAFVGAATMRRIINPVTLLVTSADVDALRWIRTHTPAAAKFAVGVQPWIADSYMGVDGGYWIPLVSDRASILPPGLYPWVMSAERVDSVTATLAMWRDAELTANTAALAALRAEGVTHVYFGAKNASPLRAAMPRAAGAKRVYAGNGVEIYELP